MREFESAHAFTSCDCADGDFGVCTKMCMCMYGMIVSCRGVFVYVFAHLWNVSCMNVLADLSCIVKMSNIMLLHEVWSCLY